MKFCAVVVLYNPDESVYGNILSYIDSVEKVYMVDNSDKVFFPIDQIEHKSEKIAYIGNNGNKGIADALNEGIKHAIAEGYNYVLTMDQDSRVSANMFENMLKCLNTYNCKEIGIISPFHASKFHSVSKEKGCVEKKMVMTSGNLLSLDAYSHVGPFLEELFLDYVDNEYCLRLHRNGYKVIQASEAILQHNLGELSKHNFFGKYIYCYNYPPIRYYYRTRNVIAMNKEYNYFDYLYVKELAKDIIKIILYENNKLEKIRHIYLGIMDALKGKLGKFDG